MELTFLTPLAAVVGAAVLAPLVAALLRERRASRLRAALGLAAPSRAARLPAAVTLVALVALLAVAAAQPALRDRREVQVRKDAEAFFVVDISRSMLASRGAGGATRLARALAFAEALRARLPELPAGFATLTDRTLPNLFPTANVADFERVAEHAVRVEDPPPVRLRARSTDFTGLSELTTQNYFPPTARRRVVVLLTDGESVQFDPDWSAHWLRSAHMSLVVVRFWHGDERIRDARGAIDAGYRPDASAAAPVDRLVRLVTHGRPFREDELGAATDAIRRLIGRGPTSPEGERAHVTPLSGYFVAAAAIPLVFLLLARGHRLGIRRREQGAELEWEHA